MFAARPPAGHSRRRRQLGHAGALPGAARRGRLRAVRGQRLRAARAGSARTTSTTGASATTSASAPARTASSRSAPSRRSCGAGRSSTRATYLARPPARRRDRRRRAHRAGAAAVRVHAQRAAPGRRLRAGRVRGAHRPAARGDRAAAGAGATARLAAQIDGDRVRPTELGRRFTNDVIALFLEPEALTAALRVAATRLGRLARRRRAYRMAGRAGKSGRLAAGMLRSSRKAICARRPMPSSFEPLGSTASRPRWRRQHCRGACAACWNTCYALVSDEMARQLEHDARRVRAAAVPPRRPRAQSRHRSPATCETLRTVRLNRADLVPQLPDRAGSRARRASASPTAAAGSWIRGAGRTFRDLRLVEDDAMDEEQRAARHRRAPRSRAPASPLHLLGQRFGVLAARRPSMPNACRSGPQSLCRILREASQHAADRRCDARLLLFRTFDRHVMAGLRPAGRDDERAAGATRTSCPSLAYVPMRTRPQPAGESTPSDASGADDATAQRAAGAWRDVVHGRRAARGGGGRGGSGGDAADAAGVAPVAIRSVRTPPGWARTVAASSRRRRGGRARAAAAAAVRPPRPDRQAAPGRQPATPRRSSPPHD